MNAPLLLSVIRLELLQDALQQLEALAQLGGGRLQLRCAPCGRLSGPRLELFELVSQLAKRSIERTWNDVSSRAPDRPDGKKLPRCSGSPG